MSRHLFYTPNMPILPPQDEAAKVQFFPFSGVGMCWISSCSLIHQEETFSISQFFQVWLFSFTDGWVSTEYFSNTYDCILYNLIEIQIKKNKVGKIWWLCFFNTYLGGSTREGVERILRVSLESYGTGVLNKGTLTPKKIGKRPKRCSKRKTRSRYLYYQCTNMKSVFREPIDSLLSLHGRAKDVLLLF